MGDKAPLPPRSCEAGRTHLERPDSQRNKLCTCYSCQLVQMALSLMMFLEDILSFLTYYNPFL